MKRVLWIVVAVLMGCGDGSAGMSDAGIDAGPDAETACGDGIISAPEVCDGTDIQGWTCPTDYPVGDASCIDGCSMLRAHCCRVGGFPCFDFNAMP